MKIVLATPLYPPDIAEPAPYVKGLAKRLSETDEVTIVTYGHIPEEVASVRIYTVSKQRPLPLRLISYTFALLKATRGQNILYIQNGPSVELPALMVSFFRRIPIVVRIGDAGAHRHAQAKPLLRTIEGTILRRAEHVVTDSPNSRPEILPFKDYPTTEFETFEHSWENHLASLADVFRTIHHV